MTDPLRTRTPNSRPSRRHPAADLPLRLRTHAPRTGVVVVATEGEIDLANRQALAAELAPVAADPATRLLVCDLSGTAFVACSGLSVLLEARARLVARGGAMCVVATERALLRMLEATGQRAVLDVRPTLAAALGDDDGQDLDMNGDTNGHTAGDGSASLAALTTELARAVAQTTELAAAWGRLAEQVAALDADLLADARGGHWRPRETLAEMAEDLRVLQNHLATGALLAAPTVEDLSHLRAAADDA